LVKSLEDTREIFAGKSLEDFREIPGGYQGDSWRIPDRYQGSTPDT
jgi:hypothetical protein